MKILIAVDDSTCSEEALQTALQTTVHEDDSVRLLTVVQPFEPEYGMISLTGAAVEAQQEYTKYCQGLLERRLESVRKTKPGLDVHGTVVLGGIVDRILDEADDWGADLIVLGTHGRRGWRKFILGSVAEGVTANAHCSVEIVRPKQAVKH